MGREEPRRSSGTTCSNCGVSLLKDEGHIRCSDKDYCGTCFATSDTTQVDPSSDESSPWTVVDTLALLDAVAKVGVGSWDDVLARMRQAGADSEKEITPAQCRSRFMQLFIPGYTPRRGDFEVDYDDCAELLLADMEFNPSDRPEDTKIKADVLLAYNARLSLREEMKRYVVARQMVLQQPPCSASTGGGGVPAPPPVNAHTRAGQILSRLLRPVERFFDSKDDCEEFKQVLRQCEASVGTYESYGDPVDDSDDQHDVEHSGKGGMQERASVSGGDEAGRDDLKDREMTEETPMLNQKSGSEVSIHSMGSREEEPSAIRPFTPTVNGTWHSHFIQRTVTIKEKPLTLKELKSLVKTARLPSMRTSTKPTSYTFNSWAPLAIGGGLSYSLEVPSSPYTMDGGGAEEVSKIQKLCGLKKLRDIRTHYISVCKVRLSGMPRAFIDSESGLPTIRMEARSLIRPLRTDITIEFVYDRSEEAYGAFVAHALMLEEEYRNTRSVEKKGKKSVETTTPADSHVLQSRAEGYKALTDPCMLAVFQEALPGEGTVQQSSPPSPGSPPADDGDGRGESPNAVIDDSASGPAVRYSLAPGSSRASISEAEENAVVETPLVNYTRLPPLNLQTIGYDFFTRQGVPVKWMTGVDVSPRACIPFESESGEKMMFTPISAGIGGESINGRMMMYMVQYGATERSCRGLVEDYDVDDENEQTIIVREDKKILTELTKVVGTKKGGERKDIVMIPRVVPFYYPLKARQRRRSAVM
ncbi:hypothetical protein Pmar_PMAR006706 [Perkinsus marinus ATCC 50983]|uniref:Myb-like domain-containing protein n=1 Tax=Perkinsus marinus (strain ATCC 50983 / TXsc) TaxID=423536 RepID=C5LRD0_PERM5|nr:hypothetical protein Pmar_PMAR006706 [Perkinsus marinus ATCC 50983]EER00715.1 hypothetical protein Pmar_PMAR006706 [Perkinsus marinus ATCC 50983]|eukprot:XP_002767997.1 hypothetical protein Pmar_PMAR006706 [Perkinsus marinus ATCC 50983]